MIVYDAGVLVAADRSDRDVWADHRVLLETGISPTTTAPVVAQVSRTGRRAQLRRFLRACKTVDFAEAEAHDVGALLGASGTADVVDAHVIVIAARIGATVLTADPDDLTNLAAHVTPRIAVESL
jgi:predicted nucleic acid-binding protein